MSIDWEKTLSKKGKLNQLPEKVAKCNQNHVEKHY